MRRALSLGVLVALIASSANAAAQGHTRMIHRPPRVPHPVIADEDDTKESNEPPPAFRTLFGIGRLERLAKSSDPADRLRAIERAGAIGTPEALQLIAPPSEPLAIVHTDPEAWVLLVRALAPFASQEDPRKALLAVLNGAASRATMATHSSNDDTQSASELFAMAGEMAALALASAADERVAETLFPVVRGTGFAANAAAQALVAYPPQQITGLVTNGTPSPTVLALVGRLGDLRAIDALRASHPTDPRMRRALLLALAASGDSRAIAPATEALEDEDPRVRVAAAQALVLLDAPNKAHACELLLTDDATAPAGAAIAIDVESEGIVKALAARAVVTANRDLRTAAIVALGRAANTDAVKALLALLHNELARGDAADALARSPSPTAMRAIEEAAQSSGMRRLMTRAYVVRRLVRNEASARMDRVIAQLAASDDVNDRALAAFALVALHHGDGIARILRSRDPEVRRAAAVASIVTRDLDVSRALLEARAREKDEATRAVLSLGLLSGDPDALATTHDLESLVKIGAIDAPLAAFALAAREEESHDGAIDALLASKDERIRAHAARGLAKSRARDATGRLAAAYAYEVAPVVRRAEIEALAARDQDHDAPVRAKTLLLASRIDPDARVRWIAARALGRAESPAPALVTADVAWLRAIRADAGAPQRRPEGALVDAAGWALPIAFDADGYALVPGVAPGAAHLVLAPEVPTYNATTP